MPRPLPEVPLIKISVRIPSPDYIRLVKKYGTITEALRVLVSKEK